MSLIEAFHVSQVPGAGDDVIIDRPAGEFTVTYRDLVSSVNSITSRERLIIGVLGGIGAKAPQCHRSSARSGHFLASGGAGYHHDNPGLLSPNSLTSYGVCTYVICVHSRYRIAIIMRAHIFGCGEKVPPLRAGSRQQALAAE